MKIVVVVLLVLCVIALLAALWLAIVFVGWEE